MMGVSVHLDILVTLTPVKRSQCPLHMKFAGPMRQFECDDEEKNSGRAINPAFRSK
jgi:hypothetical protein